MKAKRIWTSDWRYSIGVHLCCCIVCKIAKRKVMRDFYIICMKYKVVRIPIGAQYKYINVKKGLKLG